MSKTTDDYFTRLARQRMVKWTKRRLTEYEKRCKQRLAVFDAAEHQSLADAVKKAEDEYRAIGGTVS